ncbi:hypothetical protein R1flu_003350 [Riccia fluitans]|uniref:Protein SFI1 homolog n=1 Tax=Riccia fluitans TaxID=41844 RepID=A0ABD1Y8T4_9MARC
MTKVHSSSSKSAALAALLTEEEIRAYRHHRKRLARIVADQWLFAARFRLLIIRFRKQHAEKLKRHCLCEWRALVEERRRISGILERASVLRRFLQKCRSFHSWHIAVHTRQMMRKAFYRTTEIINRSTRRRVLVALQVHCRRRIHRRGQKVKMKAVWQWRLAKRCLMEWHYLMHERRLWKKKKERAEKKWTARLLDLTLRGWNGLLAQRETACSTETEAVINPARDKKLIVAQRHHERKLLRSAYDGWDRVRFSSCLAREVAQHCLEASAMEVAVSWFMKSLVKRMLVCWKNHALIQKNHRRNHWHAIVHFKMQTVSKGLRGFQKNVELEQTKRSLQELSLESYQQRLKRKAVTGCRLLHQTKRLKSAKLENATAQWKSAKLREHFEKWYCAKALSTMKKRKLLDSIKFSCRQLCLRGFQTWCAVRDIRKQKTLTTQTRLNRMRETLSKQRRMHVLRAWRSLQKEIIIKRINEARSLQFYLHFTAAAAVKALRVNMQKQKRKRSLLAKAREFCKTKYLQRAVISWKKLLLHRQLVYTAADHRRRRLLKAVLVALAQKEAQEQVDITQEETNLQESLVKLRKIETAQRSTLPKAPSIKPMSASRAPPRRPAFLYENDDQTQGTKLGLKPGDHDVNFGSPAAKNLQFVAKEVEWMEQILLEYEDLQVQLVKFRAELALLLETRSPDESESFHPRNQKQLLQEQKTLLLQQEIHSLEAKKMVQMPLIQAVLSRIQDLRTNKAPTL